MQKSRSGLRQISSIIKRAQQKMGDHDDAAKECRRVDKIFNTVYRHAISHGQSHRRALKYCINVYSEQAPVWSRKIVIQAINAEAPMKINRAGLRKLINEALLEEGIIDFVPRPAQSKSFAGGGEVITPTFGGHSSEQSAQDSSSFISALESIQEDVYDLAFYTKNLSPSQKKYLDALADMLSDAISDEGRIEGTPDEFDDIGDIEDYPEDESSTAAFLRSMGTAGRKFNKFNEPTDDED